MSEAPFEGVALEAVAALDEATALLGAARAEAHMTDVLLRCEMQAQIDALTDIVEEQRREIGRKERVIERLLAAQGKVSPREALRRRWQLVSLVGEATRLRVAGHGHMSGKCPMCRQGEIHVWLGVHQYWTDCCRQSGDSVDFMDALAARRAG